MTQSAKTPVVRRTKNKIWAPGDWLHCIKCLDKLYPQFYLSDSRHTVKSVSRNIRPAVMFEAQILMNLPESDQRRSFSTSEIISKVEQAIKDLRAEVLSSEVKPSLESKPTSTAEKDSDPFVDTDGVDGCELPPVSQASVYEAAFSPLIQIIAAEVFNMLKPRFDAIEGQLSQLLNCERVSQHAKKSAAEEFIKHNPLPFMPPQVVKKFRIGVVGVLPVQASSIASDFPELEFCFVEKGPTGVIAKVQNCNRIIGMVKFMNHSTDGVLSKTLGDKYSRISGGPSDAKRLIRSWVTARSIASSAS